MKKKEKKMSKVRVYTLNNSQDKVIISVERKNGLYSFYETSMDRKNLNENVALSPVDNIFDYASIGMQYNEGLTNYYRQNEGIDRSNGKKR